MIRHFMNENISLLKFVQYLIIDIRENNVIITKLRHNSYLTCCENVKNFSHYLLTDIC